MTKIVFKRALGVLCLIVGFIGLVAPIIPGVWLIFIGLELLGLMFLLPRPVRELYEKVKMKLVAMVRHHHERAVRALRRRRVLAPERSAVEQQRGE